MDNKKSQTNMWEFFYYCYMVRTTCNRLNLLTKARICVVFGIIEDSDNKEF